MLERLQQPHGSGRPKARRRTPQPRGGVWHEGPPPATPAADTGTETGPTLFGLPADVGPETDERELGTGPSDRGPVVRRRPDRVGGGVLVLAGLAANVSLSLSWSAGPAPSGLSLVELGIDAYGAGLGALAGSGLWPPLVVVASGGILVLLGFLLFVPARAHRLVGVLALLVTLAAAAAVVVLLADAGWDTGAMGPGMWFAAAVPVLGLVGALQAMLTARLVVFDAG
jgi:hypothetical protein